MKFVDIKNDIAFRKIFGNENRKEVLISFLNAVLLLENNNKIITVDILTPYQLPTLKGGKVTIVDIKARDQNQKTYIVEMQVADVDGFDKRVLYYASKSYSTQIERGDQYKLLNIETGENLIKDIEFNFIELPKFNKRETDLKTIIDQWVYFIKNAENLDVIPDNVTDQGLKHAYQDADKHNWTKEELEAYDYVLMREQDDRGRVTKVQKTIAKKLVRLGLNTEDIAESTGLTLEQVNKLQNEG
jgi:hypothetical protein